MSNNDLINLHSKIYKHDVIDNNSSIEHCEITFFILRKGLTKTIVNRWQNQIPFKSKLIFENRLLIILHKKGSSIDFLNDELLNKGFVEK